MPTGALDVNDDDNELDSIERPSTGSCPAPSADRRQIGHDVVWGRFAMKRRWFCRAVVASVLLGLLAPAVPPAAAVSSREKADPFAEVNTRWEGARCRTRLPVKLKKGSGKGGWTDCKWFLGEEWGDGRRESGSRTRMPFAEDTATCFLSGPNLSPAAGAWKRAGVRSIWSSSCRNYLSGRKYIFQLFTVWDMREFRNSPS